MSNRKNNIRFFLGSNTKRGFVSLFDQIRDPKEGNRLYFIKGGPGTGKSSFMKRIAKALEDRGHQIEYIPCASDPNSLDAIIDHDVKVSFMDATAPHTMDPAYPGAYDRILNLADLWDEHIIEENRNEIIEVSSSISFCHAMATTNISAAAVLLEGNRKSAAKYINHVTISSEYQKLIKLIEDAPKGKEKKRLVSAVSVGEFIFYEQTIKNLCPTQYVIQDEWGASSQLLLSRIREFAISNTLDFITCYCSIQTPDKIDHLLFPSIGIAISSSNSFHTMTGTHSIDHCTFPIEYNQLTAMTSNLTLAQTLIKTATEHINRAKELHDDLEKYYINAMNFSKLDPIFDDIMTYIDSLSSDSISFTKY